MSDTPKLPVLAFGAALSLPAAAGSLYLGALLFARWLSLQSAPSLLMLPHYWQHYAALPDKMRLPLVVSSALTLLFALLPLLLAAAAILSKPKRELHGSARFANGAEIAQTGLLKKPSNSPNAPNKPLPPPALLLGKWKGQYLRWQGSEFLLVAARTRAGKGVSLIIPNCLNYRDSMVVYDPKFENFLITSGFRASMGQKVFLFNPGGLMPGMSKADFDTGDQAHDARLAEQAKQIRGLKSHRWNPFSYVSRNPLFMYKDASNMAAIMLPMDGKGGSNSSSFWVESARKLFVGLSLYMLETEYERAEAARTDSRQRSTLSYLYRLTTPANGQSLPDWIKEELAKERQYPLSSQCRTLLGGFANGNAKTNADIIATMTAPLGIFLDPIVETATSGDDFRLDDIRRQRMTIYLGINPAETDTFARLTNLFFSQLVQANIAQGLPENNINPQTGRTMLPHQCLLLMDEFAALGSVRTIQEGASYVAGYGLRLMIIVQSPAQIEAVYGRENARTFFTNFACRAIFTPRDQTEAEEYSRILGNETVQAKSVSRSSGKGTSRSQSISDQKRALMYESEIKLMPMDKCILDMTATRPIYADKIRYYDDPAFKERANRALPEIPDLVFSVGRPSSAADSGESEEARAERRKQAEDEAAQQLCRLLEMLADDTGSDGLGEAEKAEFARSLRKVVADSPETVKQLLA